MHGQKVDCTLFFAQVNADEDLDTDAIIYLQILVEIFMKNKESWNAPNKCYFKLLKN